MTTFVPGQLLGITLDHPHEQIGFWFRVILVRLAP